MKINKFEQKIKTEIDPRLRVVNHPTNTDVAGVYLDSMYIAAIPSKQIFDVKSTQYTDAFGTPHRTVGEAMAVIRGVISQFSNNDRLQLFRE